MRDINYCSGMRLKASILAGINWFNLFKDQVDAINVFPVPDSDTGKNMHRTFLSISAYLKDADRRSTCDVARKSAQGALLGARGCSGIIISGFFRGFAEGVEERRRLNSQDLTNCFKSAADKAYQTVINPKEGTILTVAKDMANATLKGVNETTSLAQLIKIVYDAAKESVQETPKQLKILSRHGVVDAGGLGLFYFLEGMMRYNFGQSIRMVIKKEVFVSAQPIFRKKTMPLKFCTELILRSSRIERRPLEDILVPLGDSLIISQIKLADKHESMYKIHIHTKQPKSVLRKLSGLGVVSDTKIDDMQKQHLDSLKERG